MAHQGGQAIVYQAIVESSGESVIIKQALHDDAASQDSLNHEAFLLKSLNHKSIPQFIDHFTEQNRGFLVMKEIRGSNLDEIMGQRKLSFAYDQGIQIFLQLLEVVEYLQSKEVAVVHRDIKPHNVILTPDNLICLLDFGISKRSDGLTLTSGGSFRYAPPEQLDEEGTDGRADIYGIAATVYYVLTGAQPVSAWSRKNALAKGSPDPLDAPNQVNPQIPPLVSRVIMQAMNMRREERPNSALVMKQWLEAAIAGNPALEAETLRLPRTGLNSTNRATPRTIVVVPIDSPTPGDVTETAKRVMVSLDQRRLAPEVIHLLIEVLDNKLERRFGLLDRRINQFFDQSDSHSRAASNLFQSLVANLYIDPQVKKNLRSRLGQALAGHVLSDTRSLPSAPTPKDRSDLKQKTLRNLGVWAVRGLIVGVVFQFVVVLVTAQSFLDHLLGESWLVILLHIFLIALVVLIVYLIRDGKMFLPQRGASRTYWFGGSFFLGLVIALVAFHDFVQMLSG